MTAADILAEIPRPSHVAMFESAIAACPNTTYALSAMVFALESIDFPEAAELVKSIRAKMADLDIAAM